MASPARGGGPATGLTGAPAITSKTELFSRVADLENENDGLRELLEQWRQWYVDSYKPQILYLHERVSLALADAAAVREADGGKPLEAVPRSPSPLRKPIPPPLPVVGSPKQKEMQRWGNFWRCWFFRRRCVVL